MRGTALVVASIVGLASLVGCSPPTPELTVTMTDYAYEPRQLSLQPGQRAVLVLQNRGSVEHNPELPELRLSSGPIAPGQTGRLEVAAPARVYKIVCTIPGHEEQGMVGELRVQRR